MEYAQDFAAPSIVDNSSNGNADALLAVAYQEQPNSTFESYNASAQQGFETASDSASDPASSTRVQMDGSNFSTLQGEELIIPEGLYQTPPGYTVQQQPYDGESGSIELVPLYNNDGSALGDRLARDIEQQREQGPSIDESGYHDESSTIQPAEQSPYYGMEDQPSNVASNLELNSSIDESTIIPSDSQAPLPTDEIEMMPSESQATLPSDGSGMMPSDSQAPLPTDEIEMEPSDSQVTLPSFGSEILPPDSSSVDATLPESGDSEQLSEEEQPSNNGSSFLDKLASANSAAGDISNPGGWIGRKLIEKFR